MAKQPNIVVFLSDDHAQWALGCYGNREVMTPNLDYLAETGVCMLNAFTPTPVCSPSRACFHTGRLASQHGIHDILASGTDEFDQRPWMDAEQSIAQILQQNGYRTGFCGKWHLGQERTPRVPPGYDDWFSLGPDHPRRHGQPQRYNDQGAFVTLPGSITRNLTERAIRFIRQAGSEKPFFLFVGHFATHSPWEEHPERLLNHYRKCSFSDIPQDITYPFGQMSNESAMPFRNNPPETRAQYYASATQVDESVGQVIDSLEALGLRDETLLVYTSDHGLNMGQHGVFGKSRGTLPLNMLEESMRIPLIFNAPGRLFAGQRRGEFVDHLDTFQTLLEFAGITLPEEMARERRYPGRSFGPLLTNRALTQPWRVEQFGEYGDLRLIRTRQHKLLLRYGGGENLLFDLLADPRETTNLYYQPEYHSLVEGLTRQLEAHFAQYQDPEKSGLRVRELPRHNPVEAWRI